MGKDLGRGPTDPSPHVGGASAPDDWGIKGIPPLFHDPLWVGQPHQIILKWLSDPQGVEWWGWVGFLSPSHRLYEPRLRG